MDRDAVRRDALEAERLSASEPRQAQRVAIRAQLLASKNGDGVALALAERALGLVARELNDLRRSRQHLRRSIRIAGQAGETEIAAVTRTRLAYVLSLGGDTDAALEELDRAEQDLPRKARAQLTAQRALVLQRAERTDEALAQYRLAIPTLRRAKLALDEAQALSNRAVLYTYRGDYSLAEADLRRAESLAPAAGAGFASAKVHHNLGFVAARRGNIPEALSLFDQAQAEFSALGLSEAPVLADRCETLLSVGIAEEGLQSARLAVEILEANGTALDLAEARLMAARAGLLAGESTTAVRLSRRSRTEFRKQKRPGWESLADYVIARARINQSPNKSLDLTELEGIATRLESSGWLLPAVELRLAWAQKMVLRNETAAAVATLEQVARGRAHSLAQVRAHAWHAEALLRLHRGDTSSARAALRSGLRVLDVHRMSLGATELRVHAASRAEELATLGFEIALSTGKPASVFEWAERWRAGALRQKPVRPTARPEIDALLDQLRHVTAEMEQAALDGNPTDSFLTRQGALERQVRDRTRQQLGTSSNPLSGVPSIGEVRDALAERVLIEYVSLNDQLYALSISKKRTKLFAVCSMSDVQREAESLRFSYARLARGRGSRQTIETFAHAAEHAGMQLNQLLLAPLSTEIGDSPLVIVPTGRLHHLPWAALSDCADKTLSVAPSAAMWMKAQQSPRPHASGRVVLVAGPGVPHADAEIAALAKIYPRATALLGERAKARDVQAKLDGAHVAHIAAHGSFRVDNPLFSSIQLADGRLTVYDLELLDRAPRLLVLSACESGLNAVRPGDELLGLAASVLSLGCANLMASVVPIPDETTANLMVLVHGRLRRGEDAPTALATARTELGSADHAALVTSSAFVCFGA